MMSINIDKITTKTGDTGKAWSCNGMQNKSDKWFDVIGDLDELNAAIGLAQYHACKNEEVVLKIQSIIFDLGGDLFSCSNKITQEYVEYIEDICAKHKPEPITSFVLPTGPNAHWHIARAICRRAERNFWGLSEQENKINKIIGTLLNRLSDCLFMLARMNEENLKIWHPYDIIKKDEK